MATAIKPTAAPAKVLQPVVQAVHAAKPAATAVVNKTVTTKVSKFAALQARLSSGASYVWNSRPIAWIGSTGRYALAHTPELMAFSGVAIAAARLFHFYKPDAVVPSTDKDKPDGVCKKAYLYINGNDGHTKLSNKLVLTLTVALVGICRFSK